MLMTVSQHKIEQEHDKLVKELKNMSDVQVVEDYGTHEENNQLVPENHPDEGGMWVREIRVELNGKSWSNLKYELDEKSSDAKPLTIIQESDLEFGKGGMVTVRICCNEDA